MQKISVVEKNNGYLVVAEGFGKENGEYVFSSVDVLKMIEFIGTHIYDANVEVKVK